MKNTLTVTTLSDRRIQTDFVTIDGCQLMEIHRAGLSDAKVLTKLLEGKHYQNFKGEWSITFADECHTITKPTFEKLIDAAQLYIFTRDNSINYSDFG